MSDPYTTQGCWARQAATMSEQAVSEKAERYRRLADEFERRVRAVPADRWESPSPCEGWSARDVLRHVIDVHRDMPGYGGLTIEFGGSVDEDPVAAWTAARAAMQELMDDPARAGTEYDGYFGRTTVGDTVERFLGFDLLIHGWDIARATGGDEKLPAGEVNALLAQAADWGDSIRGNGICADPVPVPDNASDQDKLLGFVGRKP
jgi:uncharacterized protein (TIGR03086 family)